MASLTDTFFGQQPTTVVNQAPGSKPAGYGFARSVFDYLGGLAGTQFPGYQGAVDPGMSPLLQDIIRRSQGYAQSSPSELLQGTQGTLGRFQNPSFANPQARMFGGSPDYAGVSPNQTMWGGRPAGDYQFQSGMPNFQNASMPGQGQGGGIGQFLQMLMQQMGGSGLQNTSQPTPQPPPAQPDTRPAWMQLRDQGIGGQGSAAANRAALAGLPGQLPTAPTTGGGGQWGIPTGDNPNLRNTSMPYQAPNPTFNQTQPGWTPQPYAGNGSAPPGAPPSGPLPTPQTPAEKADYAGSVPGGSFAWSMGPTKNYGMTREGAGGREIYVNGGGGESMKWVPYNDLYHKDIATMHSRYGSNWNAGSGSGVGGHSSDVGGWFKNAFGRDPSLEEKMDYYYNANGKNAADIKPTSTNWQYQGPPR